MDIEQMFFNEIAGDKYAEAKALAYVVFRELVEDVHEKYNIPDATIHE